MKESCMTCRWVGCRDYGKALGSCDKYIPEIKIEPISDKEEVEN